jgi:methyltransferase (TIGR00027 family)
MIDARPSRTALRVAMRRAEHQIFDHPKVLDDPIAVPILGAATQAELRAPTLARTSRFGRYLRAFMVGRSRYAEDELAGAVARGAQQYVILGAGLDTFAYRNPFAESALRVFEVDYPATQAWKRERLAAANIPIPASLRFAPVDFERQSLSDGLQQAGYDSHAATFFSWLGVTPYLTADVVMSTFRFIAASPAGGGVVFDYAVPRELLSWRQKLVLDFLSRRVAAAGEPFRTFFAPAALAAELRGMGFSRIEDLGTAEMNARYFQDRADRLRMGGAVGRLMSAQI